jgi:hypothetical protein
LLELTVAVAVAEGAADGIVVADGTETVYAPMAFSRGCRAVETGLMEATMGEPSGFVSRELVLEWMPPGAWKGGGEAMRMGLMFEVAGGHGTGEVDLRRVGGG